MPRLTAGGRKVETKEALAIDGPGCLSVGRQVEHSAEPMNFVHGKRRQGFAHGKYAEIIDQALDRAANEQLLTATPAQNYVPRLQPDPQRCAERLAVLMEDTDVA